MLPTDHTPRILIVGPTDPLLEERAIALGRGGYVVERAATADAKRRIMNSVWDVVVLAQSIDIVRRRALGEWIHNRAASTRVITLHHGKNSSRIFTAARASVERSPDEVLRTVKTVLGVANGRERKRILFLTSERLLSRERVSYLKRAGYTVVVARTFREVEDACAAKKRFDLVIFSPGSTTFKARVHSIFKKQHGPVRVLQIGPDNPRYSTYMSHEEVLAKVEACLSSGTDEGALHHHSLES